MPAKLPAKSSTDIPPFATRVIAWQRAHGRHGLPWQGSDDPYRIWLSEIMLQQTQVVAVIPYFEKFIARFPNVSALARANVDDVLAHWAGLGYYARARNLHAAAKTIVTTHAGEFPHTADGLAELKGVGRSTANAIAAFSFGARVPILDGNVKRVLARHAGVEGYPGERTNEAALWAHAHTRVPVRATHAQMHSYTQGMMDLGAQICRRRSPSCLLCPVQTDCVAHRLGRTDEIPAPRPSKVIPHRNAHLAVLIDEAHVYLKRRPAQGIWGGLLSLPEFTTRDEAKQWLASHAPRATLAQDAQIEHAFTHYTLTLHPLRAFAKHAPLDLVAVPLMTVATQGIPAPIKKYLLSLGP